MFRIVFTYLAICDEFFCQSYMLGLLSIF